MNALAQWWDDLTGTSGEEATSGDIPAWMISLVVHMSLLLILGTVFQPRPEQPVAIVVTTPQIEEEEKEEVPELQQFRFSKETSPDIGSASVVGVDVPVSVAPEQSEKTELPVKLTTMEIADFSPPLVSPIAATREFNEIVKVRGAAGVNAVGAVGAVDRITQEILLSLEEKPTLVVWLFDRSGSMGAQRRTINDRFDRIYQELGVSHLVAASKQKQPLLSAVMSFGKDVQFLVQPTDDVNQIKAAVSSIPNDDSGVEMVFTAVGMAAQKYQTLHVQPPHRNVMIIVCTDEVGDDEDQAEEAAKICRRNAMPVYVIGTPAPFGRRNIEVKYVDPDPNYDQSVQWIPVRQGPETFMPEQVQLGFTGRTQRDDEIYRIESGFGPFSLTRLCYQTGGIFFAVHSGRPEAGGYVSSARTPVMSARLNYFFDPAVMHNYAPDYLPAEEYKRRVSASKTKSALVQAAEMSMVMPMNAPQLLFPKDGDNEAAFKGLLDQAQKSAAVLEPRINMLYGVLKLGEADRSKVAEPRWQAGFDLAMGRVLAVKVRTESYNMMLARAKNGMKFQDPKSNAWELVPDNQISVGSAVEKQAKQGRDYLERVVRDHAGTPWAFLAKFELNEPIGWKWAEKFIPPPPPPPKVTAPPPVNNNNAGAPRPQQPAPRPQPKPLRQNVKL
jgi:hypothetical protein